MTDNTQDSDELEALFDSIVSAANEPGAPAATPAAAAEPSPGAAPSPAADGANPSDQIINSVGRLTRMLHDSLRELGYEKNLEKAASSIPDARDRLKYIADMTEQAAERVLNATEAAQPVVEMMETESQRLAREWQKVFDKQLDVEQFKNLAMQTHAFLSDMPNQAKVTSAHLMEIMMAQDFQDLTGQVIKKIMDVTQQMEKNLVELLVQHPPSSVTPDAYAGLLNGPVVNAEGRTDVVTSQDQVDDLLESMGF